MGELITKESLMGAQKVIVGDGTADVILRTLGKVYIQAGARLKLLDDFIKELATVTSSPVAINNLTILPTDEDLLTLVYPGDGQFVFISASQNLYITVSGEYLPIIAKNEATINWDTLNKAFVSKSGDIMTGSLKATEFIVDEKITAHGPIVSDISESPFIVKSTKMVENLNVEQLGGLKRENYAVKAEDEAITGQWDFENQTNFKELTTFKKDLVSADGFASGYSGFGWKLDTKTNTLTVDNLIVRRIMQVYELVVAKIRATNGALWVADADKVMEVTKLTSPEVLTVFGDDRFSNWKHYSYDGQYLCSGYDLDGTRIEFFEGAPIKDVNGNVITPQSGYDSTDDLDLVIALAIPGNPKRYLSSYFTGEFYRIVIENPKMYPFRVNDIVRCQKFTGSSIKTYDALVTNIAPDSHIIIRLAVFNIDGLLYEIEPEVTDGLVRIGNINNQSRQGAIYMTSSEQNSPYMDILTDVNRPDFAHPLLNDNGDVIATPKNLKLRLGNLSGIYDPAFGPRQPSGMGLYGENVFLKGNLVQVTAGEEIRVPVYRGVWDYTKIYWINDQVTFNEVIYTCIGDILTSVPQTQNPEVDSRWESSVSSLMVTLSNPSVVIGLDKDGVLKSGEIGINGKSTLFTVYKGTLDVTSQYSLRLGSYSGVTLDILSNKLYISALSDFTPKSLLVTLTKSGVDVRSLFWSLSYSKDGQAGAPGNDGAPGKDGTNGSPGAKGDVGPSLTYEGEWSSTTHYYNRVTVRTVVKRTIASVITYYITKLSTTGNDIDFGTAQNPETHPALWETFAGQFTSVATGLLLAENAVVNIAANNTLYIGASGAAGISALGWKGDSNGFQSMRTDSGGITPLTILNVDGSFITQKGTIGGWTIDATSISSPGNLIKLNSAGHIDIQSTGYLNIGSNISLKGNSVSNFGGLNIGTDGTLYADKAGTRTFQISPNGDFLFNGNFYLSNQAGGNVTAAFSDLFDVILNPDGVTIKALVSKVNFASKGDITAYQVGALDSTTNGVLALLTGTGPIYKPSDTEVGLRYDTGQFQLSGGNTLQIIPSVLIPQSALDLKLNVSLKGSANGLAELDASGFVKNTQLPSYVDDVLEFSTKPSFPTIGETGKIYVALDTNVTYRWSGSVYVVIGSDLALGETSASAYRGDRGKIAYDHTFLTTNPHGVTKAQVGLSLVDNTADSTKSVSYASAAGTATNWSGSGALGSAAYVNTSSFAPSGYGVGGSPVVTTDADNYKLTGDYYFVTPIAHSPQAYFQAHVMGSSNGDFAQIGVASTNEFHFRWGTGTWHKVWNDGNLNRSDVAFAASTGSFYSNVIVNSNAADIVALTLNANTNHGVRQNFYNQNASGLYNFQIGSNITANNAFEILASTALDGSGFSNVFKITNTGVATFASSINLGALQQIIWGGGYGSGKPLIEGSAAGMNVYPKGNLNDGIFNVIGTIRATVAASVGGFRVDGGNPPDGYGLEIYYDAASKETRFNALDRGITYTWHPMVFNASNYAFGGVAVFNNSVTVPVLQINTAAGANSQDAILLTKANGYGTAAIQQYYSTYLDYGLGLSIQGENKFTLNQLGNAVFNGSVAAKNLASVGDSGVAAGVASSSIRLLGNGLAHSNIAWQPNERTISFHTSIAGLGLDDYWGAVSLYAGGVITTNSSFKTTSPVSLVGNYDTNTTEDKCIWTIGTGWNTVATMYGIGYDYEVQSGFGHSIFFKAAGNKHTWISLSTGNIYTTGSFVAGGEITAYSDRRLKSNIQPLTLRGDLKPMTYEKDGKQSIGFIAQDVQELYPELVKGEGEEMLSLNYGQLTAVLYAEILELKNKIKKQNKKLKKLKNGK